MASFTNVCGVILNMEVVTSVRLSDNDEKCYLVVSFANVNDPYSYLLPNAESARKEWADFIAPMTPKPIPVPAPTIAGDVPASSSAIVIPAAKPYDDVCVVEPEPEPYPDPPSSRRRKKGDIWS